MFSKVSLGIVYTNTGHYANYEVQKLNDLTVTNFGKLKRAGVASFVSKEQRGF